MYVAIGDVERWQRLTRRLAAMKELPMEVEQHLQIARRAHEQQLAMRRKIDVLAGVHSRIAAGVLVVDHDARLLFANDVAHRLLTGRDGLALAGECIEATTPRGQSTLSAAIERAGTDASAGQANDRGGPFILLVRPDRPPLTALVLHSREPMLQVFEERAPVMLLIFDTERAPAPGPHVLRELFGLTVREAELTSLLIQGHTLREAADAMGVTVNTVRTFLSRVTAKTDSRSQAGLMERLLAIPRVV